MDFSHDFPVRYYSHHLDLPNVYLNQFYLIPTSILRGQSACRFWMRSKIGSLTLQSNRFCLEFKNFWRMSPTFRVLLSSSHWLCTRTIGRSTLKRWRRSRSAIRKRDEWTHNDELNFIIETFKTELLKCAQIWSLQSTLMRDIFLGWL